MTEDDKPVALITGGAGGIGAATARRFAAGGWRVVVTDKDVERLAQVVTASDGIAHGITADLRQVAECRRLVEETASYAGRLDCLVNAAGVWTEGPVDQTTEQEWDLVLDVNLKGLYFCISSAVPHLEASGGCIVNLSSDAGLQGNTGAAVYCASKGAVTNLTRALALELAARGVRVNAVCPGDVDSPMLHGQARDYGGDNPQEYLDSLLANYPQGLGRARFIRPDEIAEVIWFLAQPTAAAITGANWSIDFGLSAGV